MKNNRFSIVLGALAVMAVLGLGRTPLSAASPVSHLEGDWYYWCPLPEGYTLVIPYPSDRADFVRTDPDGTHWSHLNANKVPVKIYDRSDNLVYLGLGKIETSCSVIVFDDGSNMWDGRTGTISVMAYLDDEATEATESARFFLTGVLHDMTWVQGNLEFEPLGWDMRFHNERFTWAD